MARDPRSPLLRLLALLVTLALAGAACGDDDDDSGSASGSASASASGSEVDADDGEGAEDEEDTEPLTPEQARDAGSAEVYERIASSTDCAQLADELQAHEANANGYFADDPERGPIFREYANATRARMKELDCPENAEEATTTSTTAPAS